MASAQVRSTYIVFCPNGCGASARVTEYQCGCSDYVMLDHGNKRSGCDKSYFGRFRYKGVGCGPARQEGTCFVTTACVEFQGLPSDCRQVVTLRSFRDNFLSTILEGRQAIAEYEVLAPQLVAAIRRDPDAAQIFEEIYHRYIEPSVELVEAGRNEDAFILYRNGMIDLARRYLA